MDKFTVLGLLGPAGSGKDLTADWFSDKGFVKIAFADPIKRFAQKSFGFSTEQLWGPSKERNKEIEVDDAWWYEVIGHFGDGSVEIVNDVLHPGIRVEGYLRLHDWLTQLRKDYREKISARVVLQTLGTEWGRKIDPLLWVNYTYRVIDSIRYLGSGYTQVGGPETTELFHKYNGAIIPDHRFFNELEETQRRSGYVMRIRRLSQEPKREVGIAGHQSEAEQKDMPDKLFDLVLEFEEGIDKVHNVLDRVHVERLWNMKRAADRS